ncbi:hypothetical protein ACFU8W_52210 [Streptomyces sp. NPDC057565]|uniref:hypothetical protein n=1 Tax=Streptomyces sp. NPDC057565 TaxID=3346169 RepID=UPI00367D5577
MGLAPDLTLAGFLVAEHRQVEDLWLHWTAKNISFDTALGYHLYHLLTGGIAATVEVVRASAHPERNRILKEIASSRHTDAAVEEWLEEQRRIFPPGPAEESLKTWAYHAARLGEREASRLFMTEWAADEPRTDDTLNTLQFHLAHLGYLTEAVAVQKEAVAICQSPPESSLKASKLLRLVQLQRQVGDFAGALQSLEAAGQAPSTVPDWPWMGMWNAVVKEYFLLVPVTPDEHTSRLLLAEADEQLQRVPQKWLAGVLDPAIAGSSTSTTPPSAAATSRSRPQAVIGKSSSAHRDRRDLMRCRPAPVTLNRSSELLSQPRRLPSRHDNDQAGLREPVITTTCPSSTSSATQQSVSGLRRLMRLKIIQHQVGHDYASATAIYTCVSSDFRTCTLRRALDATIEAALRPGRTL